jgi:hypothetical protein
MTELADQIVDHQDDLDAATRIMGNSNGSFEESLMDTSKLEKPAQPPTEQPKPEQPAEGTVPPAVTFHAPGQ